ncbi:putative RNA methyltransferase [Phytoactinopolyspora halotolerans]|uniref:23S rRNA (guanine(745)-N(1))-methyltransferase N-terminal domain-containing protein n=1 Tax=Phytoactinopolyspora halotolerans TaxID=1981512 RepID=A0A6L9S7C0_9ACTN|nr:hypothetical protein [Phytoactinopolyspora halotolerans]NEE01375.1 hypothetical protein [Phytoactinopolyspora halotolerans]
MTSDDVVGPLTGNGAVGGPAVLEAKLVDALACPVCRARLTVVRASPGGGAPEAEATVRTAGSALRCASGHSFDVARQGYVNLRSGRKPRGTADTADMVAARTEFLDAGHYAPIADAVARAVGNTVRDDAAGADPAPPLVVDIGAGTGYYLRRTLDVLERGLDARPAAGGRAPWGVAIDVSTYALRRAAKAHPRIAAVGADAWDVLPVADGAATAILDVFAPRNAAEFHRVLSPDGVLVVVTPTSAHLAELVGRFGASGMLSVDERKDERVEQALGERFAPVSRDELTFSLELDPDNVARLIRMGPSAHHVDDATLRETLVADAAAGGARTNVTASVSVATFRARR